MKSLLAHKKLPFFEARRMGVITEQERRITEKLADGLTTKEMAAHFNLSENTIIRHIENAKDKTLAANRANYVAICFKLGILQARKFGGYITWQLCWVLLLLNIVLSVSITLGEEFPRGRVRPPRPPQRVPTLRGGRKD